MRFFPKLTFHGAKDISIDLNFENPESVSIGGRANLIVEILEPQIFKNAETFESLTKH